MGAPWTGDANRSQGALLIRPAAFRAREPVDAPYRVRVHDLDGRLSLQTELDVYLSRLRNVCEVDATRAAPPP